MTSSVGMSSG